MTLLPLVSFEPISRAELNARLVAWSHAMGPCTRPAEHWSHGLRYEGELVAVVGADTLIREQVAGLSRAEAVELSRLCAAAPGLCRVALRLWREFVFRPLARERGWTWAVSYQDEGLHTGATYRFDGWVKLARSRSGTDQRSGRRGRTKTIWGFSHDAEAMRRARAAPERVAA
jgi:hypothetical protein